MSIFLEKFILPNEDQEERIVVEKMRENGGDLGYIDNFYPCCLFTGKQLSELDFDNITILYGGNGSGKSTLLNLIASKLNLRRVAPYNSSEVYDKFVEKCEYRLGYDDYGEPNVVPVSSRIITSDDVFDYMLNMRVNNKDISDNIEDGKRQWLERRFGDTIKVKGIQDYENLRLQVMARRKTLSRRKFVERTVGKEVKLNSNGETAFEYFKVKLQENTLYCLDEPENSLSPRLQLELVEFIEQMARYFGCQFIISTHSPFLLALKGAKIYDLDSSPVDIKKWWELENSQTYFNFFDKHKDLFLNKSDC